MAGLSANIHSMDSIQNNPGKVKTSNAIVKIDELSARMEETYDNLDDGIQAVEERMGRSIS